MSEVKHKTAGFITQIFLIDFLKLLKKSIYQIIICLNKKIVTMYLIIDIRMIIESRIACEGNLSSIDYQSK